LAAQTFGLVPTEQANENGTRHAEPVRSISNRPERREELRVNSAKHLLFLIANKQKQIPRAARDDIVGPSFIGLLPT
jgi:hypothetical protein